VRGKVFAAAARYWRNRVVQYVRREQMLIESGGEAARFIP
jgi:hypothetical protein